MSSSNSAPSSQSPSDDANSSTMRTQQRRGSVTGAALSSLFRSSSNAQNAGTFSSPVTAAAIHEQRRRLSISTLGLSGTAPAAAAAAAPASFARRGSISTNSDVIDEAVSEEDLDASARTAPVTPFHRRMSFGAPAMWSMRAQAGSPGSSNPDQGFIWSEQLRSRAESSVAAAAAAAAGTQPRASFSFAPVFSSSPPRTTNNANGGGGHPQPAVSPHHDRAKSVSDMPAPPAQLPRAPAPRKPDHMQERILKGDFYMD